MQEKKNLKRDYEEKIENKRKGYELTARMIGYTIQKMKEASLISGDVKVTGRLKSFKSASENYKKKAIDDCFGIRIIANKPEDLEAIRKEIENIFVVEKTKNHREKSKTGYNAVHQMVHIDNRYINENHLNPNIFPIIEIQYWEEELERMCISGELSYSKYKKRDVTKIAQQYKENPYYIYENLPIYYEINGNSLRRLSKEETLIKIYPEIELIEQEEEEDIAK